MTRQAIENLAKAADHLTAAIMELTKAHTTVKNEPGVERLKCMKIGNLMMQAFEELIELQETAEAGDRNGADCELASGRKTDNATQTLS
jgi:hypothetical protein